METQDLLKGHLFVLSQVGSRLYPAILAPTLRRTAPVTEPPAADPSTSPRAATSPANHRPRWSVTTTSALRRTLLTPEVKLHSRLKFCELQLAEKEKCKTEVLVRDRYKRAKVSFHVSVTSLLPVLHHCRLFRFCTAAGIIAPTGINKKKKLFDLLSLLCHTQSQRWRVLPALPLLRCRSTRRRPSSSFPPAGRSPLLPPPLVPCPPPLRQESGAVRGELEAPTGRMRAPAARASPGAAT